MCIRDSCGVRATVWIQWVARLLWTHRRVRLLLARKKINGLDVQIAGHLGLRGRVAKAVEALCDTRIMEPGRECKHSELGLRQRTGDARCPQVRAVAHLVLQFALNLSLIHI